MQVLVVEDEPQLAGLLQQGLTDAGMQVDVAASGERALDLAREGAYAVICLDRGLPGVDGVEVCRRLRAEGDHTPVLMLTARDAVSDRIVGLEGGADDYLVKPFDLGELIARLRVLARRPPIAEPELLCAGGLRFDPTGHRLHRGEVEIELSATESRLLEVFLRHPGRALSRLQLLEEVWGEAFEHRSNVIDVYVRYLREKIDRPFGTDTIETVRGVGYRLRDR